MENKIDLKWNKKYSWDSRWVPWVPWRKSVSKKKNKWIQNNSEKHWIFWSILNSSGFFLECPRITLPALCKLGRNTENSDKISEKIQRHFCTRVIPRCRFHDESRLLIYHQVIILAFFLRKTFLRILSWCSLL